MGRFLASAVSVALIMGAGAARSDSTKPSAPDLIITGGTIITMAGERPATVEAIAIDDGRIVFAGSKAQAMRSKGAGTVVKDLHGQTMLPGFIDPHSHFISALTMADRANVAQPPAGPARTAADVIAELKKHAAATQARPGDLIVGGGYDNTLMPEGQKVDRALLDKAFPDNPVVVLHVSLHGAVINSLAMARFGLKDGMETPKGGVIVRRPGTQELDGLVMEAAYLPVFLGLPSVTPATEMDAARKGQMIYAAAGITTAQEGATHAPEIEQLQRIAKADGLIIDVVAYPFITDVAKVLAANPASGWGKYDHRLKLGGCKITIDGSPQAKTAWFTTPYLNGGPNGEKDWKGAPGIPEDMMLATAKTCYDNNLQLLMHANGDAAIDFLIKAHETAAGDDKARDRRTVCIHCQFVRPDQLAKFKQYKIIPALFTLHTYFFYDAHRLNRGDVQAGGIAPIKSAFKLGLKPTNHTDYPVTPINQLFTVWSAVNRISRAGVRNGQDQRITPYQALQAITINAAWQYREEAEKGSIEKGKRADLVILSGNPLKVKPDAIKDIKVVETIKDGKTIFEAGK